MHNIYLHGFLSFAQPIGVKGASTILNLVKVQYNYIRSKEADSTSTNNGGGGWVELWCWVNFQCRGVQLTWIIVGQGPTALAVSAGEGGFDTFSLIYHFSFLSPSLWETA